MKNSTFLLADTWWFGGTARISLSDFEKALNLRKKQGFNAIQIVAGVPPEVPFFAKEAQNEGGHPFTKDFELNIAYFEELDKKIQLILKNGLKPIIYGGWGHHIDIVGIDGAKRLWKELVSRYGNLPVVFCLTGEADVFLNGYPVKNTQIKRGGLRLLEKVAPTIFQKIRVLKHTIKNYGLAGSNKLLEERVKKWNEVGKFVESIKHSAIPLTVHVSGNYDAATLFGNPSWLTLNSFQSGHSHGRLYFMRDTILRGKKPIINLEPWYEGIFNDFKEHLQRQAFWICALSGASGHGYGAHGVWQIEKKNGFMSHWGDSSYEKALGFMGASALGKGKKLIEAFDFKGLMVDRTVISPQFNKSNQNYPIAARLEDKTFIYFPAISGRKFTLKLAGKAKLTWILTQECNVIATEYESGSEVTVRPDNYGNEDKLLIVEPN